MLTVTCAIEHEFINHAHTPPFRRKVQLYYLLKPIGVILLVRDDRERLRILEALRARLVVATVSSSHKTLSSERCAWLVSLVGSVSCTSDVIWVRLWRLARRGHLTQPLCVWVDVDCSSTGRMWHPSLNVPSHWTVSERVLSGGERLGRLRWPRKGHLSLPPWVYSFLHVLCAGPSCTPLSDLLHLWQSRRLETLHPILVWIRRRWLLDRRGARARRPAVRRDFWTGEKIPKTHVLAEERMDSKRNKEEWNNVIMPEL